MVKSDAAVVFASDSGLFGPEPSLWFVTGSSQSVPNIHRTFKTLCNTLRVCSHARSSVTLHSDTVSVAQHRVQARLLRLIWCGYSWSPEVESRHVTGVEHGLTWPAGCHGNPAGCGGRCGESPAVQRPEPPDGRADRPAGGNIRAAVSFSDGVLGEIITF